MRALVSTLLTLSVCAIVAAQTIDDYEARLAVSSGEQRVELLLTVAREELRRQPESSLERAQEALGLAESLGLEELHADARAACGHAYSMLGRYDLAQRELRAAVEVFRGRGDAARLARSLGGLGVVFEKLGDFDRAVELQLEALTLFDELGAAAPKEDKASCLTGLGVVNYRLGQRETALGYFERALKLQQQVDDTRGISNSLNNIGVVLKSLERFDESLDHYRRALVLRRSMGETKSVADTLSNIGVLNFERGDHAAALASFREVLTIREELGDRFGLVQVIANIGELYRHMGQLDQSVEHLERARELSVEIGARDSRQYVLLELAKTREAQGEHAAALTAFKEYSSLRDELNSAQVSERIAELQTRFEVERKEAEIELLRRDRSIERIIRNGLFAAMLLLAVIAALAIRSSVIKKRSARVIRMKNEELESVDRIVRLINRQGDFESLLLTLLDEALASSPGAEMASFLVLNRATQRFHVLASRGQGGEARPGVALTVEKARRRYFEDSEEIHPDIFVIRRVPGRAGEEQIVDLEQVPMSMLVMAVRLEDEVEGILVLDSFTAEDAFDDQDVNLLVRLKEHVLSAFVKTRMLRDLKDLSDAKSDVIRIAAHDIRSPLASIMAGLQALSLRMARGKVDSLEARAKLDELVGIGGQGVELLERLLDLSVIESGADQPQLEPVDLSALLEECVGRLRSTAERKEIALSIQDPPPQLTVTADRIRVAEVVDNLLSNALKYTHPGGWVRLGCANHDGEVVVSVEDNGQGLGAEDLELVFRSFRRLSAKPTGGETSRGIGLAIAKTIVERHDGRIWVDSERGRGSTFSFSLPLLPSS